MDFTFIEGLLSSGMNCPATKEAPPAGGITKEMWTVVLADNGAWLPTDIFADTQDEALAALELIHQCAVRDIRPGRWNIKGAKTARCIVTIYPPDAQ